MKNIKRNPCNIGLRMAGGLVYYFDENGIYQSIPVSKALESGVDIGLNFHSHFIKTWLFRYLFELENLILVKKAICMLTEGDCLETLDNYLSTVRLEKRYQPEGIDRFISKIERPIFERIPENIQKDTFDYIRVSVYIVSEWATDRKQFISEHTDELHRRVLNKLASDKSFQKFNIPLNFLKVSKITFSSRLNLLEYIFEIKDFS